tara:strand:+ start:572 stop:769 length:198 start_codon:yes stop_codon:yes gene_type:complete
MFFKKPRLPVTKEEVRNERYKFENFAAQNGIDVGRNEAGYYDDSPEGTAAWIAWRERAFEGRTFL